MGGAPRRLAQPRLRRTHRAGHRSRLAMAHRSAARRARVVATPGRLRQALRTLPGRLQRRHGRCSPRRRRDPRGRRLELSRPAMPGRAASRRTLRDGRLHGRGRRLRRNHLRLCLPRAAAPGGRGRQRRSLAGPDAVPANGCAPASPPSLSDGFSRPQAACSSLMADPRRLEPPPTVSRPPFAGAAPFERA